MDERDGFLLMFHCESNPGYAIRKLELTFIQAIRTNSPEAVICATYTSLQKGVSAEIEGHISEVIVFEPNNPSENQLIELKRIIKKEQLRVIWGFDIRAEGDWYSVARRSGVTQIFSYWGAPISSMNRGIKLFLKRLEMKMLRGQGPNEYIFESEAMRELAVYGRGISSRRTHVVHTGVDPEKYRPAKSQSELAYANREFEIPLDRRIVFYSGHMEERKGVHVIIEAARILTCEYEVEDVHFLIVGNSDGQEKRFLPLYADTKAEQHITFGGYREDVPELMRAASIGVIASTGWDSWPMSSLEMASSNLPQVVSDLQGLNETVLEGLTGLHFRTGDASDLAVKLDFLLQNPDEMSRLGNSGRARIVEELTTDIQIRMLAKILSVH